VSSSQLLDLSTNCPLAEYAAAFFLLADHLRDAAQVCINQLSDIQLAIAIARVYEGDDSPVLKEILEERVLVEAAAEGNRWMASWAFWMLNRRDMAVRSLIVSSLQNDRINKLTSNNLPKSPIESLIPPTPASPGSPGTITLQAKSYLSNDPALVVLYKQLREKTLQTLKGASQVPPLAEWNFVLRNARLYDRMGCDPLALDLVRNWEFLRGPQKTAKGMPLNLAGNEIDYRKLLKRRSSLVIADLPYKPEFTQEGKGPTAQQTPSKPQPTVFQEPDANSLLDSFGF